MPPEPGSPSPSAEDLKKLLKQGYDSLNFRRYGKAVEALKAFCDQAPATTPDYYQAHIWLVKAYRGHNQSEQAIALCTQLLTCGHASTQIWAEKFLPTLTPVTVADAVNAAIDIATEAKAEQAKPPAEIVVTPKTLKDLQAFYRDELIPDLKNVERKRRRAFQNVKVMTLFLAILTLIGIDVLRRLPYGWIAFLAVPMGALSAWVSLYAYFTQNYTTDFKPKIIAKLVKFLDPRLQYAEFGEEHSTASAIIDSQIFQDLSIPNRFRQDDCVYGKLGSTKIFFSEVCAESEMVHYDSDSGLNDILNALIFLFNKIARGQRLILSDFQDELSGKTNRLTLFKGLFFIGDFNKRFKGLTIVVCNRASNTLGKVGIKLRASAPEWGDLVKLEDPRFMQLFTVYSDDQIEARYILSTSLMAKLVDFRQRVGHEMRIAFNHNSIYIAIHYDEDLLEPKLFKSMLAFEPIQEYFETLQLAIGIVKELNLNRRIWG